MTHSYLPLFVTKCEELQGAIFRYKYICKFPGMMVDEAEAEYEELQQTEMPQHSKEAKDIVLSQLATWCAFSLALMGKGSEAKRWLTQCTHKERTSPWNQYIYRLTQSILEKDLATLALYEKTNFDYQTLATTEDHYLLQLNHAITRAVVYESLGEKAAASDVWNKAYAYSTHHQERNFYTQHRGMPAFVLMRRLALLDAEALVTHEEEVRTQLADIQTLCKQWQTAEEGSVLKELAKALLTFAEKCIATQKEHTALQISGMLLTVTEILAQGSKQHFSAVSAIYLQAITKIIVHFLNAPGSKQTLEAIWEIMARVPSDKAFLSRSLPLWQSVCAKLENLALPSEPQERKTFYILLSTAYRYWFIATEEKDVKERWMHVLAQYNTLSVKPWALSEVIEKICTHVGAIQKATDHATSLYDTPTFVENIDRVLRFLKEAQNSNRPLAKTEKDHISQFIRLMKEGVCIISARGLSSKNTMLFTEKAYQAVTRVLRLLKKETLCALPDLQRIVSCYAIQKLYGKDYIQTEDAYATLYDIGRLYNDPATIMEAMGAILALDIERQAFTPELLEKLLKVGRKCLLDKEGKPVLVVNTSSLRLYAPHFHAVLDAVSHEKDKTKWYRGVLEGYGLLCALAAEDKKQLLAQLQEMTLWAMQEYKASASLVLKEALTHVLSHRVQPLLTQMAFTDTEISAWKQACMQELPLPESRNQFQRFLKALQVVEHVQQWFHPEKKAENTEPSSSFYCALLKHANQAWIEGNTCALETMLGWKKKNKKGIEQDCFRYIKILFLLKDKACTGANTDALCEEIETLLKQLKTKTQNNGFGELQQKLEEVASVFQTYQTLKQTLSATCKQLENAASKECYPLASLKLYEPFPALSGLANYFYLRLSLRTYRLEEKEVLLAPLAKKIAEDFKKNAETYKVLWQALLPKKIFQGIVKELTEETLLFYTQLLDTFQEKRSLLQAESDVLPYEALHPFFAKQLPGHATLPVLYAFSVYSKLAENLTHSDTKEAIEEILGELRAHTSPVALGTKEALRARYEALRCEIMVREKNWEALYEATLHFHACPGTVLAQVLLGYHLLSLCYKQVNAPLSSAMIQIAKEEALLENACWNKEKMPEVCNPWKQLLPLLSEAGRTYTALEHALNTLDECRVELQKSLDVVQSKTALYHRSLAVCLYVFEAFMQEIASYPQLRRKDEGVDERIGYAFERVMGRAGEHPWWKWVSLWQEERLPAVKRAICDEIHDIFVSVTSQNEVRECAYKVADVQKAFKEMQYPSLENAYDVLKQHMAAVLVQQIQQVEGLKAIRIDTHSLVSLFKIYGGYARHPKLHWGEEERAQIAEHVEQSMSIKVAPRAQRHSNELVGRAF